MENVCCCCGKVHASSVKDVVIGSNAVSSLPQYLTKHNVTKVFLLADRHTYAVAGQQVCQILEQGAIAHSEYIFEDARLAPDETSAGRALMHYDTDCQAVVVGAGVLNDLGKLLSHTVNVPYIIIATAPSMDGYASATSSVDMDGLKVSCPPKPPM